MLNIDRALGNDRLIKAMTGVSASEFNKLTKSFEEESQNEAQNRYEMGVKMRDRERKPGGGRIGNLESPEVKLFFYSLLFQVLPHF